jgi:hypothetical protein
MIFSLWFGLAAMKRGLNCSATPARQSNAKSCDIGTVETNIVLFKVNAIRAVTNLMVAKADSPAALEILAKILMQVK